MQNETIFEEKIVQLSKFGKFHLRNFVLLAIILVFASFGNYASYFTASTVNYRCKIPELDEKPINGIQNKYEPSWLYLAVPYENNKPAKCIKFQPIYVKNENGENTFKSFNRSNVIRCYDFIYEDEFGVISIQKEFNLTCEENQWRLTILGSFGYITDIILLPIFNILSNKFGRKSVLILITIAMGLSGLIQSFSINYLMFAIIEFIANICISGFYCVLFMMFIELTTTETRTKVSCSVSILQNLADVLAGFIAWYFQNFRQFLRAIYTPCFGVVIIIWLLPKSLPWLMSVGQTKNAKELILIIAAMNGIDIKELPESKINKVKEIIEHQSKTEEQKHSFNENSDNLFKTIINSKMGIIRWCCCSVSWFYIAFIAHSLTFGSLGLVGNKYLNYIIVSSMSIPAICLSYYLISSSNRMKVLILCLLFCGLSCFIAQFGNFGNNSIKLTFYVIAKFCITMVNPILTVYTLEFFPMSLRFKFLNFCRQFGAFAGIISPHLRLLVDLWMPIQLVIIGSSAFFTVFLVGILVVLEPQYDIKKGKNTKEKNDGLTN